MIYLSSDKIQEAIGYDEVMDAIEEAYALESAGYYKMPDRIHIEHGENTLLYMPCFLSTVFGTKILSLFPANTAKNLPVISGLVLVNDAGSGLPVAILDGAGVTALRTGAVGGVAIRHTAPLNASRIGLIGAGVQGFYQVLFACRVRKVSQVKVLDLQPEKADQLCYRLREVLPQIRVKVVRTAEDLLEESQIVITATPSLKPVMPDNENLLRGKSYIAIGSYKPEMRELPEALYRLIDQILIDTEHGLEESGDLLTPLERGWIDRGRIVKFGSFLADREKSIGSSETTLFKSVGMALFDIVVAEKIYKKALEKGIGTCMD